MGLDKTTVKYGLAGALITSGLCAAYHIINGLYYVHRMKKEGFEDAVQERLGDLYEYSRYNYTGVSEDRHKNFFSPMLGMREVTEEQAKEAVSEWKKAEEKYFHSPEGEAILDRIHKNVVKSCSEVNNNPDIFKHIEKVKQRRLKDVADGRDKKKCIYLEPLSDDN